MVAAAEHTSGRSTPQSRSSTSSSSGDPYLDSARLLDSMHALRARLHAFTPQNLLAGVFEAQLDEERGGGEELMKERLVGLANFVSVEGNVGQEI